MGSPFTYYAATAICALATLPLNAWTPGTGNESATTGFSVDTQSRNDVISFWHCVYMESEGFESNATSSQAFKDDVQRRINFYRAMAGMSASIDLTSTSTIVIDASTPSGAQPSLTTTKQAAAQAAAEMLSANSSEFILPSGGVATGAHDPHNPPLSWSSDSSTARNGAHHSNLGVGVYGPDAIDAYISEDAQGAAGAENDEVGHRRLIFQSRLQELATGDTTSSGTVGSGGSFATNALYVSGNLLASAPAQYVPWPNAGYIPEAIVPERWSLTYPGADFSNAAVTVTDSNGASVSVSIQSTTANFGDETIIWEFNSSIPSAELDDQSYNITVSNIDIGGSITSHSYQVIIINPDRLLESTDLSGSTSPPDSGANYFFNPVEHAEEYELDISSLVNATWFEGAEDGTDALIVDNTDVAYNLRTAHSWSGIQFWDTGSKAFRLVFPRNEFNAFQSFSINRTLIPRAGATIDFRFRRGYMASNSRVSVQSSTDGGVSWTELQHFSGTNNYDATFSSKSVAIPSTGQDTLIRFVLHQPANSGVFSLDGPFGSYPIGAFIDGIEPTNCDVLESLPPTTYSASATTVSLNTTTVGGTVNVGSPYTLRLRVRVGCHWFPYGSSLEVTPVAAASLSDYELWFRGQYAIVGSFVDDYDQDGIPNAVERVFGLSPVDPTDGAAALTPQISGGNIQLSHAIIPGETVTAEYSTSLLDGSWSPATVTISGGVTTASVPINPGACFIRWVVNP